jgi:hypothetical protein
VLICVLVVYCRLSGQPAGNPEGIVSVRGFFERGDGEGEAVGMDVG